MSTALSLPARLPAQILIWSDFDPALNRLADQCEHCEGFGELAFVSHRRAPLVPTGDKAPDTSPAVIPCPDCNGVGWLGIAPHLPTNALPGSLEKLAVLTARQSAGFELWHPHDTAERPAHQASPPPAGVEWLGQLAASEDDWEQQAIEGLSALLEAI